MKRSMICLFAFIFASDAIAAHAKPIAAISSSERSNHSAQVVRALFAQPEDKIDFAKAKLTIDKLVDPKIDVDTSLRQIDEMVETIKQMAGPNANTIQKLAAVRRFIYVDGDWNGHRPFQYDLSDPFGTRITNKLLSTYLKTRRGNCVSMPALFVILGDRMGAHVTLSTAPLHVFVKYVDDASGKAYNLETTSGGLPARDAWYRQNLPMTDAAVKNGVYMKTLSRKESVAVVAELLPEYYLQSAQYHTLIATAEVILKYRPNFVDAMLKEGTAYAFLMETEFKQKYSNPNDIPPSLIPVYKFYDKENKALFDRALALGWRDTENKMTTSP